MRTTQSQQLYLMSNIIEHWQEIFMNNTLMQYESHYYISFIIFFTKHFCSKDFIFTLNSLIKYLMNIKDK
jgi:hypothetical protein